MAIGYRSSRDQSKKRFALPNKEIVTSSDHPEDPPESSKWPKPPEGIVKPEEPSHARVFRWKRVGFDFVIDSWESGSVVLIAKQSIPLTIVYGPKFFFGIVCTRVQAFQSMEL